MIWEILEQQASARPNAFFVADEQGSRTFEEFRQEAECHSAQLKSELHGAAVSLRAYGSIATLSAVFALDRVGARVHLLSPDASEDEAFFLENESGASHRLTGDRIERLVRRASAPVVSGDIVLYSSGTTGHPKAIEHSWRSASANIRVNEALATERWISPYHLSSFAGLQVFLYALLNGGGIILTPLPQTPLASFVAAASAHRGSVMAATPTFARHFLIHVPAEEPLHLQIRQVTLGGEIADQPLLDGLRRRFPTARLTHIYASGEAGVCFSVHDGRAGFPIDYLARTDLPARLKIAAGELQVAPRYPMKGYVGVERVTGPDGFLATGDLVEVRGDRVFFVGRLDERINVGGAKVNPCEIEQTILELECVETVRVYGIASSVAGQLVAADIILRHGAEKAAAKAEILDHCRSSFPPYKIPRRVTFVDTLAQTCSGKLQRR